MTELEKHKIAMSVLIDILMDKLKQSMKLIAEIDELKEEFNKMEKRLIELEKS